MQQKKPSLLRSLGIGLGVIVVIIVYAYGFRVTDVSFETTREERRLTQLKRVLRALAHPDIFTYDTREEQIEVPFYLPCPEDQDVQLPEPDTSGPYLRPSEPCAAAEESIVVEGFNFPSNRSGSLDFITASGVKKPLSDFVTDAEGYFRVEVETPNRQPVAEAQHLRATIRTRVGAPKLSDTAKVTWEKIVETVFIALLATTIGTFIAIPVSFLAARNLMSETKSPLTSVALAVIGWPIGMVAGMRATDLIRSLLSPLLGNLLPVIVGLILGVVLVLVIFRLSMNVRNTERPNSQTKILRVVAIIVMAIIGIAAFIFLESLSRMVGLAIIEPLGNLGFLGNFLFQLAETARLLTPALAAIGAGAAVGGALGQIGQSISDNASKEFVKGINFIVAALAGAIIFALVGLVIDWFYQFNNLATTLYWPAGIGAVLGLVLAFWATPKQALPTGLVIYFITRTILNATRSVEPLVMAIVFVIWVGIGPFAGSLALALHTIAALAKLYSEQVEAIMPGPLEAVQATGANRLQTIVYAVVPQIVSPYISFTMYRWDINVRMSTIIGFVGGGGIGFLLQQNINLLDYRAASAQMLAIAVVVALMDYISSVVRERIV
jgi:phosphonate ABC transporter permease subunit PhnE